MKLKQLYFKLAPVTVAATLLGSGPRRFYLQYLPYAQAAEAQGGIPAVAILAQCALETGYGKHIVGNMMFGIKCGKTWKGLRQLITTTEVHSHPNAIYPEVLSKTRLKSGKWQYKVKDYFRAYPSPLESFLDYASFIKANGRYVDALTKTNPEEYLQAVAKAGYATDPQYFKKLQIIIKAFSK